MPDHSEILSVLDDLDHEARFTYRNFPATDLDELSLVEDYQDALVELKDIAKKFSKNVRAQTTYEDTLAEGLLQGWNDKLAKLESDLNIYRREVRRRILDL